MLKFSKKKKINFLSFLFFTFISSVSCSLISFEELTVSSNISDKDNFFSGNIIINFSSEMNQSITEKIICLKQNSNLINITYKWNGKNCEIIPDTDLEKYKQYSLLVSGKAVTNDNKYYDIKYERSFIYGIEGDFFSLTNFINPDISNSNIILYFKFSKQIDISNFENNFTISPNIKLKKEYSEDLLEVKLTPEESWPANTYFIWSLDKLISADKVELYKKYSESFFTYHDYIQPKLISSNLNNRKITDNLLFTFNKKIDLKSFENNFSISPYIKGYFTQDGNNIFFNPLSDFEIGKTYSITIQSKVCDVNSIPIYQEIKKTFQPINDFLKIESISINQNLNLLQEQNQIHEIEISQTKTAFIEILFSRPIKKQQLTSSEKTISLEPIFPENINFPKLTNIKWNTERTRLVLTYSNLTETNTLYRLTLNASKNYFLSDENEYMEENLCIYFLTK